MPVPVCLLSSVILLTGRVEESPPEFRRSGLSVLGLRGPSRSSQGSGDYFVSALFSPQGENAVSD